MADRPVAALIGRGDCLQKLCGCLREASQGRPRIVVVSGETGVGKTRVVGEFLKRERPATLVGACVPVAGETLPFAPLAQALRRLSATAAGRQVEAYADLARLLASEEEGDTEPGSFHQLGFFQSVLGLLGTLGRTRPIVHVVEDIHWADRSTLDLVRFLATNLVDERVLIVLTYRVDQVGRTSPVRTWLAELGRLPRVEHVRLQRLERAETLALVESLAGTGLDPGLARTIAARCDGNPLFAQHLVWHSATGGAGIPIALGDLLAARLTALPAVTQAVVDAAAVLARRASLALLAATSALPIETVEEALAPALEHHVLCLTEDDRVAFHHPALREVAYEAILPTRRVRLHRAAAQALEAAGTEAAVPGGARRSAGEIARHWHLAGDLRRALDSALAAAFAAERIYAFADAHANFMRALDVLDRLDADVDRLQILRHAARATRIIGDYEEAVRLLGVALAADMPGPLRAAVLEELAYIHAMRGHGPAAEAALRSARALIPADERSVLAAKISAGLGAHAAAYSRFEEAERECACALDLARSVGARQEEGRARNALGVVAAARGHYELAALELGESLRIARETGLPEGVCDAYINLSHVLGEAGRDHDVVQLGQTGLTELTRLGVMRQAGTILLANVAQSQFRLGRYDEADALVRRSLDYRPPGIVVAPTLGRAAMVCLVRGEFEAAVRYCDQARAIVEVERAPSSWFREVAEFSAEAELWAGRPEAALGVVTQGLEAILDTDEEAHCSWLYCLGMRALGDIAESHRKESSRREQGAMREDLARLAAAHPTRARAGDPPVMSAWIATATAEAARARGRPDPALWVTAEREWRALERPLETAYARWRHAESLLVVAVDARAIDALRSARAQARRCHIVPIIDETDRLARWYRVEALIQIDDERDPGAATDAPAPQTAAQMVAQDAAPVTEIGRAGPAASPGANADEDRCAEYGLTPRELQVLRSLTAGRTNHEIGESLGISAKTASVHVSNILRKLDVTGRAQAARVGHRLGLDRDATPAAEPSVRRPRATAPAYPH